LKGRRFCDFDGHTVHYLSQRRLTADWLVPRESDCSRMRSKVSSYWLPSYIKATRLVFEIFKTAGYFPGRPRVYWYMLLNLAQFFLCAESYWCVLHDRNTVSLDVWTVILCCTCIFTSFKSFLLPVLSRLSGIFCIPKTASIKIRFCTSLQAVKL
jgi:hypothetical protein